MGTAVCQACNRVMDKTGCDPIPFFFVNASTRKIERFEPLPFGCAHDHDIEPLCEGERCHDCDCKQGDFHHLGCDGERCPKCGSQAMGDCDVCESATEEEYEAQEKERLERERPTERP